MVDGEAEVTPPPLVGVRQMLLLVMVVRLSFPYKRVGFNIIYGLFRTAQPFVRTLYLTITAVTLASDARLPACGAVQLAMYRCSTAFSAAG